MKKILLLTLLTFSMSAFANELSINIKYKAADPHTYPALYVKFCPDDNLDKVTPDAPQKYYVTCIKPSLQGKLNLNQSLASICPTITLPLRNSGDTKTIQIESDKSGKVSCGWL